MKVLKEYTTIFILILLFSPYTKLLCAIISKNNLSFSHTFKNSAKTNNLSSTLSSMLLSIQSTIKNFKNISLERRLGGYPLVTLKNLDLNKSLPCNGWQKYMKQDNFNDKKFIKNSVNDSDEFYFVIDNNNISAYSDNNTSQDKIVDSINFKLLDSINTNNSDNGGISDIGNFKEGYCFKLRGKKNMQSFKWIVCSKSYEQKVNFINCIAKSKIQNQAIMKQVNTDFNVNGFINKSNNSNFINNLVIKNNSLRKSKPLSKWILLKDWGECTLSCGGGYQYMQRYCYQPEGADPCLGDAISKRPCNTHPCLDQDIIKNGVTDPHVQETVLPPIIKVVQSPKKQTYIKCTIKEEDMNIIRNENNLGLSTKYPMPSRVILNTHMLSIYENDNIDHLYKSYNLQDIKILRPYRKNPEKCLRIGYLKDNVIMCEMNSSGSIITNWVTQIKDFRDNCNLKHIKKSENIYDSTEYKQFIHTLQQKQMEKQIQDVQQQEEEKSREEYNKQIKLAHMMAWKAFDKEMKYEQRLEKEESMRELKDEEEANVQLLQEQRKQDSLNKAICLGLSQSKIKQTQELKKKLQLKKHITQIKEEVQNKISKSRQLFQERIDRMKRIHERSMLKTRNQINNIKVNFVKSVIKAKEKGDMKICIMNDDNSRNIYCNKHFIDDFYINKDCKNKTEFCFICCENEFGVLHLKEREVCKIKCDSREPN